MVDGVLEEEEEEVLVEEVWRSSRWWWTWTRIEEAASCSTSTQQVQMESPRGRRGVLGKCGVASFNICMHTKSNEMHTAFYIVIVHIHIGYHRVHVYRHYPTPCELFSLSVPVSCT